jgi:hypothetical protein
MPDETLRTAFSVGTAASAEPGVSTSGRPLVIASLNSTLNNQRADLVRIWVKQRHDIS